MSFEIKLLQEEELKIAAGLSRYVFDYCLRNRMEFQQTVAFVEEYITEENLVKLYLENKLVLWGVFEENQMVAVAGLQSEGMITMLYVLPAYQNKGYGSHLLKTVREYAKHTLNLERVTLNATPAWTSAYFKKRGFSFFRSDRNLQVPFIPMYAMSNEIASYEKRRVPWQVVFFVVVGSLLIATTAGVLFMISYLF